MKTDLTQLVEETFMRYIEGINVYSCHEVGINWNKPLHFGGTQYTKGIVDIVSYNALQDLFTCYEIKISKSDFNSVHGHNFAGDFNYYIVPKHLADVAKHKAPSFVGVYTFEETKVDNQPYVGNFTIIKRAKKTNLKLHKYDFMTALMKAQTRVKLQKHNQLSYTKLTMCEKCSTIL